MFKMGMMNFHNMLNVLPKYEMQINQNIMACVIPRLCFFYFFLCINITWNLG